jgi:hypothetical protein
MECNESFERFQQPFNHICPGCKYDPVNRTVVGCKCPNNSGVTVEQEPNIPFYTSACSRDQVMNDNGRITCENKLPLGAYQQTCRGCTYNKNPETLLTGCDCEGRSFTAQQDFRARACSENSISNDRGKLVCMELPGGSYIDQCRRCTVDAAMTTLSGCECKSKSKGKHIPVAPLALALGRDKCGKIQFNENIGSLECTTIPYF